MMKQLVNTAARYRRLEFWVTAFLFAAAITYFLYRTVYADAGALQSPFIKKFEKAGMPFDYYENYVIPLLIRMVFGYGVFMYLNFVIVPKLLTNSDPLWNILRLVLLFFFTGFMFGATNVMLKKFVYGIQSIEATLLELYGTGFLYAGFWFVVFGFYTITKYAASYMLTKRDPSTTGDTMEQGGFIRKEGVVAFLVWVSLLLLMIVTNTITLFTLLWIVLVPPAIMLYQLSFFRLIPDSLSARHPFRSYCSKVILILAALFLPVAAFVWVILHDGPPSVMISIMNTAFQVFVTIPVSWKLYKKYRKGNEELVTLKKELGQSTANFDFLRSQINPHFLFNALNTLYGTALEERSERTAEGIQRLGDMMRFMLQENMREKIPLSKELEYMNHYISLQQLRTGTDPNIYIQASITEDVHGFDIAPMLLIPFVENAFKHGISFREPSFIRISLMCNGNVLQFNVVNSKHVRLQNDPEKFNTGIGMNNVRQRLQLLYPGKHELVVRESEKEFTIQLAIQLS